MRIKVMPFLQKKGNRVGQASIEFTEGILKGIQLVGFSICDDETNGMFVLMPSCKVEYKDGEKKLYFFLRPDNPDLLGDLENQILDVYESMTGDQKKRQPFNPAVRIDQAQKDKGMPKL